jgi:hypothetical protein
VVVNEYLTEREIDRLIEAAKGNRWGHRDATAILLAYRHGLRASELVALRWDDIDFRTLTRSRWLNDALGLSCNSLRDKNQEQQLHGAGKANQNKTDSHCLDRWYVTPKFGGTFLYQTVNAKPDHREAAESDHVGQGDSLHGQFLPCGKAPRFAGGGQVGSSCSAGGSVESPSPCAHPQNASVELVPWSVRSPMVAKGLAI